MDIWFNCFKAAEPLRGDSLLLKARKSWHLFNRPWKDE